MSTSTPADPPGSAPKPDPLDAAFAELPDPRVPEHLLPMLIGGIPGAGAPFPASSVGVPASSPGGPARQLAWWTLGVSAVASAVLISAALIPHLRLAQDSLDSPRIPNGAMVSVVDYSVLTQDMTERLLKDTDPCRILPRQTN